MWSSQKPLFQLLRLSSRLKSSTSTAKKIASIDDQPNHIALKWQDGYEAKFHKIWLRDHCQCAECTHPDTKQRMVDTFAIPMEPAVQHVSAQNGAISIQWQSNVNLGKCVETNFSSEWLREHAYGNDKSRQQNPQSKVLWGGGLPISLPKVSFDQFMSTRDENPRVEALQNLYKYGTLLVNNTPSTMEDTERFAEKIGLVMKTLYGEMWSTNAEGTLDTGLNDTAYSNVELLYHTDCTYLRSPPGLQIFNCTQQAEKGGKTILIDGFRVASILKEENLEAFNYFVNTPISYQCFDEGSILATKEPIIALDSNGEISQFRHNDYDRAALSHLSFDEISDFYVYHKVLTNIIRRENMELSCMLKRGQMIIVDNQRVMHGRRAFLGKRSLDGCYIGRDEYESCLRLHNII